MNLQLYLLSRITLVAWLCLLVIAATVLNLSHSHALQTTREITETLGKQLESQLLLMNAGIGQANPFPDFDIWKQSGAQAGICLVYMAADNGRSRSLCHGVKPAVADWPQVFADGYRWIFQPGRPVLRLIAIRDRNYGTLTVTPSAELEIAEAWDKTRSLMLLSTVTVLAVCLFVYLSISHALRPAKTIVNGLAEIEILNPAYRLPRFELREWRQIGIAINQLTDSQQQLLAERQQLVAKLINLQEDERRLIARELHDEYGQCLAAINALAASVEYSAAPQLPDLVAEAQQINRIVEHMQAGIRCLLGKLRPVEFEELGLATSLRNLVSGWNRLSGDKTRFQLSISGESGSTPELPAVTIFRIAQECLTNIAKHAAATCVNITLHIDNKAVNLIITDDGNARRLPFPTNEGIGLLGIRERVSVLHGRLHLSIVEPHGLQVDVYLPIATETKA